jgi:hypothetical protein
MTHDDIREEIPEIGRQCQVPPFGLRRAALRPNPTTGFNHNTNENQNEKQKLHWTKNKKTKTQKGDTSNWLTMGHFYTGLTLRFYSS